MTRNVSGTKTGSVAEDAAVQYLTKRGLQLIQRNFRTKYGEIDLIMKDSDCIVFVEVRYRKDKNFLDPLESINNKKVKNIIDTCNYYLQKFRSEHDTYRIDIITLTGKLEMPNVEWYQNAVIE